MADNLIRIVMQSQGTAKVSTDLQQVSKRARAAGIAMTDLARAMRSQDAVLNQHNKIVNRFSGEQIEMNQLLGEASRQSRAFKAEYLSLMFGAQLAARQIQRVMTSSISAFQEIATESNLANQSLAAFSANITFLRFSIGRAIAEGLEPFLPIFTDIVEKMVDFIDENPEEVFATLGGFFAAFSGLAIAGSTALFINSLIQLAKNGGALGTILTNTENGLANIKRIAAGGIGVWFIFQGFMDLEDRPIKGIAELIAGTALSRYAITGSFGRFGKTAIAIAAVLVFVDDPTGTAKFLGRMAGIVLRLALDLGIAMGKIILNYLMKPFAMLAGLVGIELPKFENPFQGSAGAFKEGAVEGFFGSQEELVAAHERWFGTIDGIETETNKLAQETFPAVSEASMVMSNEASSNFEVLGSSTRATFDDIEFTVDDSVSRITERLNSIPRNIDVTVNVTERRTGSLISQLFRNT